MLGLGLGLQKSTKLGGFIGLLDLFPNAAAAYSLRKLRAAYSGSAVRVRKEVSLVSSEMDIGFLADGSLDTVSLLAFASDADSGDVFVVTWYDQSLSNNATQSTAANQPKIVSGGSLVLENGKPCISWQDNDLSYLNIPWSATPSQSWFAVYNALNDSFVSVTETALGSDRDWVAQVGSSNTSIEGFTNNPSLYINGVLQNPTTRGDVYTSLTSQGHSLYATIDLDISSWDDSNPWVLYGQGGGASDFFNYSGVTQEWIVYESDESANRASIEANIANFYGITLP